MTFQELIDKRLDLKQRRAHLNRDLDEVDDLLSGVELNMVQYIKNRQAEGDGVLFKGNWYRIEVCKNMESVVIDPGPTIVD